MGSFNPRGRGRGARYVRCIQPQDWAGMSYEEQQEVMSNQGTLPHQLEAIDIDQILQVSGVTNPPAGNNNTPFSTSQV